MSQGRHIWISTCRSGPAYSIGYEDFRYRNSFIGFVENRANLTR